MRWIWDKVRSVGVGLILVHVGTLIVVALYYLLFETNPHMTQWWHDAVSNSNLRHDIRNVAEGLLGGLLALGANYYRKKPKPPNVVDKVEHWFRFIPNARYENKVRWWEVVIMPVLVLVYGAVGFVASYYALRYAHVHPPHMHNPNLFQELWVDGYDQKIMGFVAAYFFGKRPAKGVMNHVQLYFAENRVAKGKAKPAWYWTPAYEKRFFEVQQKGLSEAAEIRTEAGRFATVQGTVMTFACVIGAGLAAYGYYIMKYIAKA